MSGRLHSRLETILESTRERIDVLSSNPPELRSATTPRPFRASLESGGLSVIAEIKRRSPSRGALAADLDPVQMARSYQVGGAAAISVLTEPHHFRGSADDLVAVRRAIELPVLRKDFILDPIQVVESRSMGADAVLLIVAALDRIRLADLLAITDEMGMEALVEVHDEREAEVALDVGASVVGVNNRDLRTFDVDLATAERLGPVLESAAVAVAESGILGPGDARRMATAGYDAILVGEGLVVSRDPIGTLRALRS